MRFLGRDTHGLDAKQTHAISHPTRLRILEVFTREKGRLTSVKVLTTILATTPGFEYVTAGQVKYHRAYLQDALLLPTR